MSSYLYISTRLDIDVSSGLTHWGIPHMSELHPCIGLPAATTVNTSQPHEGGQRHTMEDAVPLTYRYI